MIIFRIVEKHVTVLTISRLHHADANHDPYWSPFNIAELPNWIRAGQFCLCSESPYVFGNHVAIDCWLENLWAS
ncbi:hypothetical protein DXZ20_01625 [Leptolyngbyaceae cyanobacterium CCMR0081]|uniref:Uncharacterized protein n=1 Tax=Adonisia turfae CCMR0081 TaxID=2292702 RepID=A0A6M0RDR2_9CYAN|nr:hypothetical protein [Adonisia turfae CCMR0081]